MSKKSNVVVAVMALWLCLSWLCGVAARGPSLYRYLIAHQAVQKNRLLESFRKWQHAPASPIGFFERIVIKYTDNYASFYDAMTVVDYRNSDPVIMLRVSPTGASRLVVSNNNWFRKATAQDATYTLNLHERGVSSYGFSTKDRSAGIPYLLVGADVTAVGHSASQMLWLLWAIELRLCSNASEPVNVALQLMTVGREIDDACEYQSFLRLDSGCLAVQESRKLVVDPFAVDKKMEYYFTLLPIVKDDPLADQATVSVTRWIFGLTEDQVLADKYVGPPQQRCCKHLFNRKIYRDRVAQITNLPVVRTQNAFEWIDKLDMFGLHVDLSGSTSYLFWHYRVPKIEEPLELKCHTYGHVVSAVERFEWLTTFVSHGTIVPDAQALITHHMVTLVGPSHYAIVEVFLGDAVAILSKNGTVHPHSDHHIVFAADGTLCFLSNSEPANMSAQLSGWGDLLWEVGEKHFFQGGECRRIIARGFKRYSRIDAGPYTLMITSNIYTLFTFQLSGWMIGVYN